MRKKFLVSALLVVTYTVASAMDVPTVVHGDYLYMMPGDITKDGKSMVYSYSGITENDRTCHFYVYDEDFNLVKDFVTLPLPEYRDIEYSQTREYTYLPTDSVKLEFVNADMWSNPLEINGETAGLTIDRVQSYVYALYGKGEIATLPDGPEVVAWSFYEEDKYGKKYPYEFYISYTQGWYKAYADYRPVTIYGPFGEWGEVREYSVGGRDYIVDTTIMPEDGSDAEYYYLTRGIFSEDVCYVFPVCEEKSFSREYESDEVPGLITEKRWGIEYVTVGYVIYDSTNSEIGRIDLPSGYEGDYNDLTFIRLGKNRYISVEVNKIDEDREYCILVYRLGDDNSVSFVTAAPSSKVSPRNPKRGEKVSVVLDAPVVKDGAMVQVVSASGQTMLNAKIPAGQTQLDINTAGFSQGMYVVTVSGNGITKEAAKIIVR